MSRAESLTRWCYLTITDVLFTFMLSVLAHNRRHFFYSSARVFVNPVSWEMLKTLNCELCTILHWPPTHCDAMAFDGQGNCRMKEVQRRFLKRIVEKWQQVLGFHAVKNRNRQWMRFLGHQYEQTDGWPWKGVRSLLSSYSSLNVIRLEKLPTFEIKEKNTKCKNKIVPKIVALEISTP